jgi:hypothetical protein
MFEHFFGMKISDQKTNIVSLLLKNIILQRASF